MDNDNDFGGKFIPITTAMKWKQNLPDDGVLVPPHGDISKDNYKSALKQK